jgi:two-component system sensor histidine kinase HydH
VPFHSEQGVRIGRIDLARSSADFLVLHARRNVLAAVAGSFVVVGLALVAAWTARRAARAEQRQAAIEHLAHIGKMAAALAHEIRNPLGTIKGYAQLLGESGADGAFVGPILSQTTRLESLVRDLLLYGRPPSPHPRRVDWREIAAVMRAHAGNIRPDIRFHVEAQPVTFETDPHLLEQALLNLVRNAAEAAESEVSLTVTHNGKLSIVVEDDGPGLSPEARKRLFEPFFSTQALGTGLGLAISRKLAASLGGRLSIEPGRDKGTAARLDLPWNAS